MLYTGLGEPCDKSSGMREQLRKEHDMKKKGIIIGVVCAMVVLLTLTVGLCWFFSPGVHFFGNSANLNLEQVDCYIISDDQIVDRTTMTAKGYWFDVEAPLHQDYEFAIANYTDVLQGGASYSFGITRKNDGRDALYLAYVDRDGDLSMVNDEETQISVLIDFVDGKSVSHIRYGQQYARENVYAVCADSEEEALSLYQEYIKNK